MALVNLTLQNRTSCYLMRSGSLLLTTVRRSLQPNHVQARCLQTGQVAYKAAVSNNRRISQLITSMFRQLTQRRCIHQSGTRPTQSLKAANNKVHKDTPVFSYSNDRLFKLITWFGIVQFVFWCNFGIFTHSTFKTFTADASKYDTSSRSIQILIYINKHSYSLAATCILLGHTVLFFTFIYPQRIVRSMILLKGGEKVKIVTYSHFGKTQTSITPLDNISFSQARLNDVSTLPLKIKGKWFNFLMYKDHGTFHNTEIFDHVVALERILKK